MPIVTRRPFSGARLKDLRERREMSQADLARKCREAGRPVTQSHISRLEAGRSQPYTPLLRALASALSVEVDDLIDGSAQ